MRPRPSLAAEGLAGMSLEAGAARVEVLLATFNGARFLREQIDSIAGQDYAEVRILARDDGSADGTRELLAEYGAAYPEQFEVMPQTGPTSSARGNFLELMHAATGPYVAFADQDDVWLAGKLTEGMAKMRALEARHPARTPLLVFTDVQVVDEALGTVAKSLWTHLALRPESIHRPARMLGQSVVTGCTMLINTPMLELARQMPQEAVMHDRWMGLLAAFLGAADFVRTATVLYRQHGGNAIGAVVADSSPGGVVARTVSSAGRRAERQRSEEQAEALLGLYRQQLTFEKKALLKRYLRSGRSSDRLVRLWLTLRWGFWRGRVAANLALLWDLARAPTEHRRVRG